MSEPVARALPPSLSRALAYLSALAIPLIVMIVGTRIGMPAFVFEHTIILLVVGIAVMWGLGPAVVAAVAAALGDNVLLRDPAGRPTITGMRDVLDALLFVVVAITVGWLVATAKREKARAEAAAARERRAREERDSLVAMVTHDLATPLGVIRGSIQFARQGGTGATADMERLWVRLDRAAGRATSLIRTLGDARALDAGELPLEVRPVDLRSLIAGVVQMMDRVSERHPIALIMPNHPVMVDGDAERLQRVFENLVGNAIKYSPDGGAVEIALVVSDGEAVVTVQDHGIGISPEALSRIFQRGYRAQEAQAIAPGLGLGLNISWEIVKRHGGSLHVRSSTPSGSMFILRLPIDAPASSGQQAPASNATTNRDSYAAP
jgi:signal transduction histidine kinase